MSRTLITTSLFSSIILLISCDTQPTTGVHDELITFFNSEGRYPRFTNSRLIFGDTISVEQRMLLQFDTEQVGKSIYRKAAYTFPNSADPSIYFIYGVSKKDAVLHQVRIRSFRGDSLIGDFLIIDLDKHPSLTYDYWYDDHLYDEPTIVVQAMNRAKASHHSFYSFQHGQIINTTIVPDTIFRRRDMLASFGQRISIYDDFKNKTLTIGKKEIKAEGRLTQYFRGEDCSNHIIVQLDDTVMGYEYIYFDETLSDVAALHGLQSDSLIQGKEACLKGSAKPYSELTLLKEKVFFDYR
ncbi:MAG: hypothetical protein AAF391_04505 [Bacteroidota bacterium]